MGDGSGHTVTVTFTVSVADIAEPPVISNPTGMSTINQNENDESMTPVAITLEGEFC